MAYTVVLWVTHFFPVERYIIPAKHVNLVHDGSIK